ncbi:uncharacterized protein ATNIH1004_001968 [Aspergillus tanneri]|uniref:Uncharacterized protein n=1 Tax=Aspergillus tanneri TaxID=1220188 RepID=A0A5M9M708_9EURO|nr:uncharacterized protein ATNIH1004_001968 [Aspergillus tanneri]KAA8641366.1 hypothetical protein ATNIH1004_001968 [Aspergillus tanneri]
METVRYTIKRPARRGGYTLVGTATFGLRFIDAPTGWPHGICAVSRVTYRSGVLPSIATPYVRRCRDAVISTQALSTLSSWLIRLCAFHPGWFEASVSIGRGRDPATSTHFRSPALGFFPHLDPTPKGVQHLLVSTRPFACQRKSIITRT